MILDWLLISAITTATVYNAVPEQCNCEPSITASGYRIPMENIADIRILAMERTMMKRHDIHYGDTIFVQGVGEYDGEWRVEDTMNRKFAGQDKIDLLVPNHIRYGKWTNFSVYKQVASVKKPEKDWWQKLIEIFGL